MSLIRIVTFNLQFGGCDGYGLGSAARLRTALPFLRSLDGDAYLLQEANHWQHLGKRRLHQARVALAVASAFLAKANKTTTGHAFHTAMLFGRRWNIVAEDSDRARYHHVLGWATVQLDDTAATWDIRNLHLDPFSPANRHNEVAPLQTLVGPGRLAALIGDANMLGINHPEPDWTPLPAHLRAAQLLPHTEAAADADRRAIRLLQNAGFVDVADRFGDQQPTGGFGPSDVPRRQDLFLLSPALAEAAVDY
ncbi:hypothetical protein [Streptomyces violascens]|uniref:hypothetical protein n=1 Tax=Streptomyces violascens TaxID=67381 RepID=UPI0036783CED